MTVDSNGRELFVDNSVSGWTGLRYLEWFGIAKAFDIATGYFKILDAQGLVASATSRDTDPRRTSMCLRAPTTTSCRWLRRWSRC